ncbi:hypothetical protein [Ensifer sp. MJa1]|uniref:hypothetical protein n=1 Tax=Ensifer sp. MJa1 TaxID=2919888 RepID=UPI00300BECBB
MTTTEDEATYSSLDVPTVRDLPPVEIERVEDSGAFRAAGSVVIRARWNMRVEIGFAGVTRDSIVMASITELFPNPDGSGINLPGIGAAHMYIRAVAPQKDKVFVSGYIDWDRDLTVRISLFVA